MLPNLQFIKCNKWKLTFFNFPLYILQNSLTGADTLNTQVGEQIITTSYLIGSSFNSLSGIPHLCIPNRPHHQNPKLPLVLSGVSNSRISAPSLSAIWYANFFVYPVLKSILPTLFYLCQCCCIEFHQNRTDFACIQLSIQPPL